MMSRPLLALVALAAVLLGAGLTLLVRDRAGEVSPAPRAYLGAIPPSDVRIPPFALRDVEGVLVTPAALAGRALVVMFVDTQCTSACPVIAGDVARGLDRLTIEERSGVAALAISVDPDNDTPASIRTFLSRTGATGRIRYLNGPLATMRTVWAAFGVLSAVDSGDADLHTSAVLVYDRDHVWVDTLAPGQFLTPADLAHDLRVALRAP